MPDYLRLVALFGIVVNVQFMAFSLLLEPVAPVGDILSDAVAMWLVNGLAMLKTYGLFSFMFGVGLGFLMQSAARRDLRFGRLYRNRMIGLFVLGVVHGCLFFPGDILATYAVLGSILYLMRNSPVRRLVWTAAGMMIPYVIIAVLLAQIPPSDPPADLLAFEETAMTQGGFLDAVLVRSIGFGILFPTLLIAQGTAAFAWCCLGLAAVKSGMIDNSEHPLWQRARRVCLLPGVGLSLLGAGLWQWGPAASGMLLTTLAGPLATLGYLGVIAAMARAPGPIMARVLAAGGSSLSIYLGQSIILSTIFSGYGFGLWGSVNHITAVLTAIAVTIALIFAVSLWRTKFELGPFEWVLRRLTYAGSRKPEPSGP